MSNDTVPKQPRIADWPTKLVVVGVLLAYVTVSWFAGWGCPIQRLTGISCPGCGMTRAVLSALRGQWRLALEYHGMVWSLPLMGLMFLFDGRLFQKPWLNRLVIISLAAGFLLHWIVRLI